MRFGLRYIAVECLCEGCAGLAVFRGGLIMLKIKRVYDKREADDGLRILVDRLWPRGISKADEAVDEWMKDLAPSHELRRWFGHEPERWSDFKRKYAEELASIDKTKLLQKIAKSAEHGNVTLVYSARDTERNNAVVLQEVILKIAG